MARAPARSPEAVLLVSADFLGSDFIASDELPPLLSAAEMRGTRIIPRHLSPSRFLKTPGLAQFQSINDPAAPLINVPVGEQEAVFVTLADAIEGYLSPEPPTPRTRPAKSVVAPATDIHSMVRLSVESAVRRLKTIRFNDELVKQMGPPTSAS